MLFLALVLKLIALARVLCFIVTIIFLVGYWIARSSKNHDETEKTEKIEKKLHKTKNFARATSVLFVVEFLLGFFSNITWKPLVLALIFAIIYAKCSDLEEYSDLEE